MGLATLETLFLILASHLAARHLSLWHISCFFLICILFPSSHATCSMSGISICSADFISSNVSASGKFVSRLTRNLLYFVSSKTRTPELEACLARQYHGDFRPFQR